MTASRIKWKWLKRMTSNFWPWDMDSQIIPLCFGGNCMLVEGGKGKVELMYITQQLI